MSNLKHDVIAERWAMLIKERVKSGILSGTAPQPGIAAAVIRKGNIAIEVTESASAGFISKIMEALANAW